MRWPSFIRMLNVALTFMLVSPLFLSSARAAVQYRVIYRFKVTPDGALPGGLVLDAAGNLYGATELGGAHLYYGTAFKLTRQPDDSWTESVLYSFTGGSDGYDPYSGIVFDASGNLYGATLFGGSYGGGTVFKLTHNPDDSWTENTVHSFGQGQDGVYPLGGVTVDANGNLYGTTGGGGTHGVGTVFKLAPNPDGSWTETTLYSFADAPDGSDPAARLTFDAAGNLYGETFQGGAYGHGTVFKLTHNRDDSWTEDVLHSFLDADGLGPTGGLTFDPAGNLYGTTYLGGYNLLGIAFELVPNPDGSWTDRILHKFRGVHGANPYSGLTFDAAGNLYGTTELGGAYNSGTVFKLKQRPDGSWKHTTLHTFKNGENPDAGLVLDAAGNLYGTTSHGGNGSRGFVYQIKP